MRRMSVLVGLVIAVGLASPARAWDDDVPNGRTLRCESSDGRTRECAVDATGGARLLRQLSRSPCIEGETWGRMRHSIWVTQGCRGEFLALSRTDGRRGRYGGAGGRVLRCGSSDGRWNHCDADTRYGVELVRQLSRSRCIRGQSWGVDRGGIWVSGGCRAEFRAGAGDAGDAPAAGDSVRFRCESSDGRPRTCPVRTPGDARLLRQLSRSNCIEGRTWGRQPGAVWVDGGCRAEFEVAGAWADGRW